MKHLLHYIVFIIFVLGLNSCIKTNLPELNENPNEQTTANPALLFKYSLREGVGSYNTDVNVEQWSLMNWVMFTASRNGVTPNEEYVMPGGKDQLWNEQYSTALINVQSALNTMGDSAKYNNHRAACMIWKVFLFHRITDLWGAIPYSEALKGYTELTLMPKYDSQKSIYYDMLFQLKSAADMIDEAGEFFDQDADLIYKGNVENWKIFANSLRLRLATRLRYADPDKYTAELQELKTARLMEANSESALFPFNSDKKNHLFEAFYSGQSIVQNNPSHFLTEYLKNTNDPRIEILLKPTVAHTVFPWFDKYKGVPNLLPVNAEQWSDFKEDWSDVSGIGDWFLRNETPGVLLSFSEVCFLSAEAAEFGVFSDAQSFYEAGIAANMRFYGEYGKAEHNIPEIKITEYISALPPADLENIITQKWLTFAFENGYEAYAEYRRTGYPAFTDYFNNPINIEIYPKRLPYPNSEKTLNLSSYNIAVQEQGVDNEFTKIWWGKVKHLSI